MQKNRITKAEQEAASIVFYKLPYSKRYEIIRSERPPILLSSYDEIGQEEGFVIAPFSNDSVDTPIVLVRPDECKDYRLPYVDVDEKAVQDSSNPVSAEYESAFNTFHDAVSGGQFRKLVLARQKEMAVRIDDAEQLFFETCARCPRQMVVLFTTPATGMWLIATPEELFLQDEDGCRTMALAGTMPYAEDACQWSEKNIHEQKIVQDYIEESLLPYSERISKSARYNRRAGNLQHLCTEFYFSLAENVEIGQVISALHPTPAVCGLPKQEAFEFIRKNELMQRKYYSGFVGIVGLYDMTRLYVSLRCAYLEQNRAVLYSGGGIMPDSKLLSEWEETNNKMQTMADVLE